MIISVFIYMSSFLFPRCLVSTWRSYTLKQTWSFSEGEALKGETGKWLLYLFIRYFHASARIVTFKLGLFSKLFENYEMDQKYVL